MEKILFLDFDGVLHSTTSSSDLLFSNTATLAKLLNNHPCKIIISSSWRFHHDITAIKKFLPSQISDLIGGVTGAPHIGKWPRYNEIKNYMIDRQILANWKALDDSFLEFPKYCEELILCNAKVGIQENQLQQLKSWLTDQLI